MPGGQGEQEQASQVYAPDPLVGLLATPLLTRVGPLGHAKWGASGWPS